MMPATKDSTFRIYSLAFSILIMALLISFVFMPDLRLSAISTKFRWRSDLISLYTTLRLKLGDRVYNSAVIGEDGWIFYTGEESIYDYQNMDPFKKRMLINIQKRLDTLSADLESRGITLLVVVPPNKSTIYSQYMPEEIPIIGEKSRLDQLIEFMNLNGHTSIIDLRQTLLDISQAQDLYYKTDSHWNDVGAYYSYVEIMDALSSDYKMLLPRQISDFEYTYVGNITRDLPKLMGLPAYEEENWRLVPKFKFQLKETHALLPDGIHYIRTITNVDRQLPELLVFGDSFYVFLAPFIEPHFGRVKTIPFTTSDEIWSLDWIQRENPDIVIIEIVERYLNLSLPTLLEN